MLAGLEPLLRELGENLREISSVKYFLEAIGQDPIQIMSQQMKQNVGLADKTIEIVLKGPVGL